MRGIFYDSFLKNLDFSPLAPSALARRLCTFLVGGAPQKSRFWAADFRVFCQLRVRKLDIQEHQQCFIIGVKWRALSRTVSSKSQFFSLAPSALAYLVLCKAGRGAQNNTFLRASFWRTLKTQLILRMLVWFLARLRKSRYLLAFFLARFYCAERARKTTRSWERHVGELWKHHLLCACWCDF